VETENPSACATVNGKVCYISDSAVLIVMKKEGVTKVLINPIIRI
jgi:hypothetical protein